MAVTINGSGQVIVQVITSVLSTAYSTTSNTPSDVGLSVSITPTNSNNKILVLFTGGIGSTSGGAYTVTYLLRGSTQIATTSGSIPTIAGTNLSDQSILTNVSLNFVDSPATTSSVTYKIQMSNVGGTGTSYLNRRGIDSVVTCPSVLTVMEISG